MEFVVGRAKNPGMRQTWIAIAAALMLAASGTAAAATFAGHKVVSTGTVPLHAFLTESPGRGGTTHADMWVANGATVLRSYDVDMTKLLHMIVVSDDLTDFQHIHPVLHPDGHFTIDFHTAHRGLYHVYIDGMPHSYGRQVFRFDIPVGSAAPAAARHLNASGSSSRVGPYVVTLDPVHVPFGEIVTIEVHITKDGKPAGDLHPYLGTMAHGVFVGVKDLAYMHAHAMNEKMLDLAGTDCGDAMMMAMPPLPPQSIIPSSFAFDILAPSGQDYDFWLQFRGGKTLYTAPFLITTANG